MTEQNRLLTDEEADNADKQRVAQKGFHDLSPIEQYTAENRAICEAQDTKTRQATLREVNVALSEVGLEVVKSVGRYGMLIKWGGGVHLPERDRIIKVLQEMFKLKSGEIGY